MKQQYVALISLLSFSSCVFNVYGQDIIFPGETERPPKYPLNPNNGNKGNGGNNGNGGNTGNGGNSGTNTQEQYNACVDGCKFTSEYNPVCGSDGVTYQNPGALNCAVFCGNPVQNLGRAPCTTTTPSPVTLPTSNQGGQNGQNGQNSQVTQEQYNNCVNNCRFTSEYNPVCGSDGVAYQNIGAYNCAFNCGNPIQNLGRGPCAQYFSTTTPASG